MMANNQVSFARHLTVMSYNMRGFNLGHHAVRDLIIAEEADILLLQEHWLTPSNLSRFDEEFPQFLCFGSSAMNSTVEEGVLRGRPFGGVMTLVSKRLQKFTKVVCVTDRYVILTVGDILLVNVYFPCVGTINRLLVYEEIIDKLTLWVQKYSCHNVIIGGD